MRTWWRALSPRNRKAAPASRRTLRSKFYRYIDFERLEDRTLPSTFQWIGGGADNNWSTGANWSLVSGSGSFPNAPGDVARFNGSYSGAQSVVVNQAITVGEIDFGTTQNVTIGASGGNVLTLDDTGTGANAVLDVGLTFSNSGVDLISAPVAVAAGTPLAAQITGGTLQLTN
ncbi:MAG TPA: hypothetical protein VFW33_20950, partial [Gemmataceae bacterium]|nr:hypothetical protein [Gemmataceae bacterium]